MVKLVFTLFNHTLDLTGRKRAVEGYLHDIRRHTEATDDPNVLDKVLSLIMQASAALNVVTAESEKEMKPFEIKERFAPAQKNEVQLRFP